MIPYENQIKLALWSLVQRSHQFDLQIDGLSLRKNAGGKCHVYESLRYLVCDVEPDRAVEVFVAALRKEL